jgi:hypothetical protein
MFSLLEIKSRYDLTWEDLPYIESPEFAHEHAIKAIQGRDPFTPPVQNLEDFRRAEVPHYDPLFNHDYVENHLRRLFFEGQYFSVSRPKVPLAPIFKWNPLADHPDGGEWIANPFNYSEHCTKTLEEYAKQLGVQKRRKMAEQAEVSEAPAALVAGVKRVKEKSSVGQPKPSLEKKEISTPQTLQEAAQRLKDAGPAVREAKANNKPLPPSSYSLADKQAVVDAGLKERFLVRVIEKNYASDKGHIGKVREHGQSISWTAPFTMVEHGDTDAEALLKAFGTRYDPEMEYTILIIDLDMMNEIGDVEAVIPTTQNLKNLIAENPKISTLTPEELEQVLSEDFASKYYAFAKEKSKQNVSSKNPEDMQDLASAMGFSEAETDRLILRQQLADQVAAWEEFTGNGMTLDTTSSDQVFGPVEVVMLDKKPLKLGTLRKKYAIKRVPC